MPRQYEKRDNSGILFTNDRKEEDRHPDWTGNATINGVDYWVSAWSKQGGRGPYFSLAFKVKQPMPQQATGVAAPAPATKAAAPRRPAPMPESAPVMRATLSFSLSQIFTTVVTLRAFS